MPDSRARTDSVASRSSVDTTVSQNSGQVAFLGATTAFRSASNPRQRPPPVSLSSHQNGALAAASLASGTGKSPQHFPSRSPLSRSGSLAADRERDIMKDQAGLGLLQPQMRRNHTRSPSQQAALLATTRAQPPPAELSTLPQSRQARPARARGDTSENKPAIAPKPRRLSVNQARTDEEAIEAQEPTDASPIAPTTSLVELFEQMDSKSSKPHEKRPEPIVVKPSSELAIKSPKPLRSGITSMLQLELGQDKSNKPPGIPTGQPDPSKKPRPSAVHIRDGSSDEDFESATEDLHVHSSMGNIRSAQPMRNEQTRSPRRRQELQAEIEIKRHSAVSPARHYTATQPIQIKLPQRPATAQSDVMSVSSSQSLRSIPAQYNRAYPKRSTPLTKGDELANALVASSLASSRAPSPSKLEPPPLPSRKRGHHHHHHLSFSRTPSPAKTGMRHTLRKAEESSSDSEEELHPYGKHRKKRLVRKHPNKHHEGDRKRWRDAVTERERKRYEGVWAANKGLHCSFTYEEQEFFNRAPNHERTIGIKAQANEQVANIVAREIWNRSRLPESVLELVWDLVDSEAMGRLHKEEFVVGMWLIDQRLRGRKLPVKVTETVWASVRGIQGIKVKKK